MIRNEKSYKAGLELIDKYLEYTKTQRDELNARDLPPECINTALEPTISFIESIKDDIAEYENFKKGNFPKITDISSIGRLLIGARIYKGMSEKELADKLNVKESRILADEDNEHFNISVSRAQQILTAIDPSISFSLTLEVE